MPTANTHLPNAIDRSATLAELVKCALASCFPRDDRDSEVLRARADACAGMLQTYCYAAYPGAVNLINSIPLSEQILSYAAVLSLTLEYGAKFDYETYIVTIIGWLNRATGGKVS